MRASALFPLVLLALLLNKQQFASATPITYDMTFSTGSTTPSVTTIGVVSASTSVTGTAVGVSNTLQLSTGA